MTACLCRLCASRPAGSPEHVVLNSLGGRLTVKDLLCQPCNNRLGGVIDSPLEQQLRSLGLLADAKKGDGNSVAPMRGLPTEEGGRIDMLPGGKPRPTFPRPVQVKKEGKDLHVSIQAGNEKEAARLLAHQLRRFGLTLDVLDSLSAEKVKSKVGTVKFTLTLGGVLPARSVAKMGMAAMTLARGRAFVNSTRFDPLAEFVAGRSEAGIEHTVDPGGRLSVRDAVGANVLEHALLVFSSEGMLQIVFNAFGVVPYWVLVDGAFEDFGPPIVHVVQPVVGVHRTASSLRGQLSTPILPMGPEKWKAVEESLKEFGEHSSAGAEGSWIEEAVESGVERLRHLPQGTILTREHIDQLIQGVMEHVRMHLLGAEVRRPFDRTKLRHLVEEAMHELGDG